MGVADVLGEWVGEGNGGDEFAVEKRVGKESVDEGLGVDLSDLFEGGA